MNVSLLPLLAAGFILWGLPTAGIFLIWNRINEPRGVKLLLLSGVCWVACYFYMLANFRMFD